jgi:hypothetical protein
MRDLPHHPAEVAHEPAGGHGDATESTPGLVDWATSGQGDWPGDGAPAPGAASTPPSGRPSGPGRGRARRRGPSRTARWLVACAAVVLALAAGVGVALTRATGAGTSNVTLSGNGANASPSMGASISPSVGANPSPSPSAGLSTTPSAGVSLGPSVSASTSPSVSASTSPTVRGSTNMGVEVGTGDSGPGTLAGVLAAANSSAEGKGLLPAANCDQYQQNPGGAIVCTAPVPGVAQVYYQNYSSLTALYDAYQAQVAELDGGTFRQNTGTCGNSAVSYAEFGWNQEEGHPHNFTVAQMASGQVGQIFASGRMACFVTRTPQGVSQDIVWTIDNGPAMGVAVGDGSPRAVYQLWASLHHTVLFRGTEMCGTAGRMNLHDIPTGNLKVLPVCPPGVQAVPASPAA